MRGVWKRDYGPATWAPSGETDGSDKPDQLLPRHIPTLPGVTVRAFEMLTLAEISVGGGYQGVLPDQERPFKRAIKTA